MGGWLQIQVIAPRIFGERQHDGTTKKLQFEMLKQHPAPHTMNVVKLPQALASGPANAAASKGESSERSTEGKIPQVTVVKAALASGLANSSFSKTECCEASVEEPLEPPGTLPS